MSDGYRGLLAPWIGGAGDPGGAPPVNAGYRGMLAPWLGGLGSPGGTPPVASGYRGMLAFWMGGVADPGGAVSRTPEGVRKRKRKGEEEILLAASAILPFLT